MPYNFYPLNREQLLLFPPSLRDWVPEDDFSWFVLDAVAQMDLAPFYEGYREDGKGGEGYDPSMMVALLIYAYCLGERSSRRIEWLCQRDVGFKVVTANQVPDHTTICRFRSEKEEAIRFLFTEVLRLCAEAGMVKVGVVALDGTKMKAKAALEANRTEISIRAEVDAMLIEARERDEEEDRLHGKRRGDELPEEFRRRGDRLERLKACKARLESERAKTEAAHAARAAERAEKEARTGRKLRGRKPKEPADMPVEEPKANVTDPESRIMKTRRGYVQGYNAQVAVTEGQVVLAAEVTQEANDVKQLAPVLSKAVENAGKVLDGAKIEVALADAGYWSESNILAADPEGPELLVATTKDWKQRKALREARPPRGRIPENMSPKDRMERKLLTKRGRRLYRIRGQTVEPVFGQVKDARGFDGFMRRGVAACDSEWKFINATHNLLKLKRSGKWSLRKREEEAGRAIEKQTLKAA